MFFVVLIALVGLMICLYGLWVEKQLERDAGYKPACDISDRASCTKVMQSPYASLLGFSNIYAGIIFYLLFMYVFIRIPLKSHLEYKSITNGGILSALICIIVVGFFENNLLDQEITMLASFILGLSYRIK